MTDTELTLRPAETRDSPLLLAWRNDPLTMAASLNPAPVSKSEHHAWLEKSLASSDRKLLIAEVNSKPVGTARLDRRDGGWELSWTLAPEARGKGLGTLLVQAAAKLQPGPIIARIKADNGASKQVARKAGFVFMAVKDDVEIWRREAFVSSH